MAPERPLGSKVVVSFGLTPQPEPLSFAVNVLEEPAGAAATDEDAGGVEPPKEGPAALESSDLLQASSVGDGDVANVVGDSMPKPVTIPDWIAPFKIHSAGTQMSAIRGRV